MQRQIFQRWIAQQDTQLFPCQNWKAVSCQRGANAWPSMALPMAFTPQAQSRLQHGWPYTYGRPCLHASLFAQLCNICHNDQALAGCPAGHDEFLESYQSTSKVHAEVLENLMVQASSRSSCTVSARLITKAAMDKAEQVACCEKRWSEARLRSL